MVIWILTALSQLTVLNTVCAVEFAVDSVNTNASSVLYRSRRQSSCQPSEYRCNSGQCISSYDKCDGVIQCGDGSDETASACKAPGITCPLMSFECGYGACIDERLRCNDKFDCADGSDENGCSRPSGSYLQTSTCSNYEFQCANGNCISAYDICDGIKHCADGSDETSNVCSDYECPPRSFKCAYGACVDPSLVCNDVADCVDGSDEPSTCPRPTTRPPPPLQSTKRPTSAYRPTTAPYRPTTAPYRPTTSAYRPPVAPAQPTASAANPAIVATPDGNGCKLPKPPKNGAYTSPQCKANDARPVCRNLPGSVVPSTWIIKYTCNSGYNLDKDFSHSICENGVWQNPVSCIKLCPPLTSQSVNVKCYYKQAEINCTDPMKPDTKATAECKPYYRKEHLPEYSYLACLKNGEWSYRLFYCTPYCGVSSFIEDPSKVSVPLITNGASVKIGEFPWLTAIYRKSSEIWDQQCGGTLITTHIVVTAAHCLVRGIIDNVKLHPTEIKVGLGKYKRDFYEMETTSIIADVKEVVIPREYVGQASQYAQDIGLLDLVISVQVTATIMPACVDWTNTFEPGPDAQGVVAGWGKTSSGGVSSEVALSARLKFIKYNDCLKRLTPGNRLRLTHDKFCAGNIDGSQVNSGDSGGGLTFLKEGKHFLVGVVSTLIPGFSLFLDITNKGTSSWLESEKNRLLQSHIEP